MSILFKEREKEETKTENEETEREKEETQTENEESKREKEEKKRGDRGRQAQFEVALMYIRVFICRGSKNSYIATYLTLL